MYDLRGKVALVTGAARGQGRSHAMALAGMGASVIALDLCADIETVPYAGSTRHDLDRTVELISQSGGNVFARVCDIRDLTSLQASVDEGIVEFGRLDIVVANAGIVSYGSLIDLSEDEWNTMIDVNLTGAWKTVKATVPRMIESGSSGSVVMVGSTASMKALHSLGHYVASKHGLLGMTKSLAQELAPNGIRVNCVAPTNVRTIMLENEGVYKMFRPDLESPTAEDAHEGFVRHHLLQQPAIDPIDVSNAVCWLVSDAARYVTGICLPVDLGVLAK